jgi:hypothetical protein
MSSSHTVGEGFAYFRFRTIIGCMASRCLFCDIYWDALQADEQEVAK